MNITSLINRAFKSLGILKVSEPTYFSSLFLTVPEAILTYDHLHQN